jgi:TonB-dependent SusC/RagA subfamily outer membrane receptor
MKTSLLKIISFICLSLITSLVNVIAQTNKDGNEITVESVITDETGKPIAGATIFGNEGTIITSSDEDGKFSIVIGALSDLLIESEGHNSQVFRAKDIQFLKSFVLTSPGFMFADKDIVNIAFGKVKIGNVVNSVSVINPSEFLQYDNLQEIAQILSGHVPGMLGGSNIRGIGRALFIVDGLPRDVNTLNLAEVEQITVLKDLNSSILYGASAVNGVVLITTKHGQPYKREVGVTGYYGVSTPTALPKYLSSAEFAQLYDEARVNDGLLPLYGPDMITNYRTGNPYRFPDIDYYSKEYLRSVKPFSRVMAELFGGNDVTTYYSNIGWEQSGSLLNFGEGLNSGQNRFNIRGNIGLKVNRWIKSSLDAIAVINNNKSPVGNYWRDASVMQPNLFAPLLPLEMVMTDNNLVNARKNDVDGLYLLGGTESYWTNPIADVYSGGINQNIQRTFSFNNKIDFDLSTLIQGLAFHTNIGFDLVTRYDQAIHNGYAVYEPTWNVTNDTILSLVKHGTDTRTGSQDVGNSFYSRRLGFYGVLDYDRTFNEVHHFNGALIGSGYQYKLQDDFQGSKDVNLGIRIAYGYKNRYQVDFSGSLVNSVKLPEGNRTAFSPSVGLSWLISSEEFLSDVQAIDYLKLKISAASLKTDDCISGFYYYDPVYSRSTGYSWYDNTYSNNATAQLYGANPNLYFATRNEINLGFEAILFNKLLNIDANVFSSTYSALLYVLPFSR